MHVRMALLCQWEWNCLCRGQRWSVEGWYANHILNHHKHVQCEESCQLMSTPCHGSCPHGHLLIENECALQESLCPEEQCASDSDCQENAGCLLSGTVIQEIEKLLIQDALRWWLVSVTSTLWPQTGLKHLVQGLGLVLMLSILNRRFFLILVQRNTHFRLKEVILCFLDFGCVQQLHRKKFYICCLIVLQEGTFPPCYEQGNTKICPFSFAKIGDTVFDWTSQGNGFGPHTYNGG